jgi:hypothetical protein
VLVAQRRLMISDPAGDREVAIRLYQPEGKDGAWGCRYEIDWPDRNWSSSAWGVDSMQALIYALQKIGTEIYTSIYHESGSLKWYDPNKGYGFPVSHNVRDLLIGDDLNL